MTLALQVKLIQQNQMHLNFFDSIAKVEIRPCVHWSFTRNLISRDHSKKPPWWLMRGDNLRKVANIGLWLENVVSFVICPLWEVLPYDVGFNSICTSNSETSFGKKKWVLYRGKYGKENSNSTNKLQKDNERLSIYWINSPLILISICFCVANLY